MANIINNTQKANEIKFPTHGNCKKVKDLTTGKEYGSITETAIVLKITGQAVSHAIKNKTLCKGHRFMLVKDLHDNIDVLCEESAKANARATKANERATKAETKLAEMEAELAEYRMWKAEQEAKRKAEEERLERERKEEEKRQAKITKLEDKIERLETLIDRKDDERRKLVDKRNKALEELKALNDGKEVE